MATMPLPINQKPFYNTDSIANSIASDDMMDCYLEAVPEVGFVTRRRPGLKLFTDLGTGFPGDGLFWWDAKSKLIAVSNGRIFDVANDGSYTDITDAPLEVGQPVTFADGQDTGGNPWLYMANGKLVYTKGGNTDVPVTVQTRTITQNATGFGSANSGGVTLTATTYTDNTYAVQVLFTNSTAYSLYSTLATITGKDIDGNTVTEIVNLPIVDSTSKSENYFKTITGITLTPSLLAADATGIAASVTGATWTFTAATFAEERQITILNNSATDHSAKTALITGKDINGAIISETVNLPAANATVTASLMYKVVSTVVPSATIGTDTMSIGWTGQSITIGWTDAAQQYGSDNVPPATHVAFLKSIFLANNPGTNQFLFTDTNPNTGLVDNAYWASTDNPLTCDAKGDNLLALTVAWQEIYAWGSSGLEIWQNDGQTPFSPIPGAFSEGGIEAPYSVVVADNTVFALMNIGGARVVAKFSGRAPVVCSEPIGRILAEMEDVSDATGCLVNVGGVPLYLLTFKAANQSWAYDYKNDVWVRWGYWYEGEHQRFLGSYSTFAKGWGKHLIMSRIDGKIYEMDRSTFDDDGREMVSYRRTGWMNHGTYNRKSCDQLYVKVKAGASNTTSLLLRWRDEGREEWSKFMELKLSPVGKRDFISKNNRFGIYRSRQYEFRISDGADLVLVGADAELTGLSS